MNEGDRARVPEKLAQKLRAPPVPEVNVAVVAPEGDDVLRYLLDCQDWVLGLQGPGLVLPVEDVVEVPDFDRAVPGAGGQPAGF